jgi:predicted secreted Zn-dependent protease
MSAGNPRLPEILSFNYVKGGLTFMSISTEGNLDWRVSRTCDNGQCVKVARNGEFVLIGNTGSSEGPVSEFTVDEWRHFIAGVKLGDFDGIS